MYVPSWEVELSRVGMVSGSDELWEASRFTISKEKKNQTTNRTYSVTANSVIMLARFTPDLRACSNAICALSVWHRVTLNRIL